MYVAAGWVWTVGRRRVAVGFSGQLCHPVALLPVALRRQSYHHPGHCCNGHRFPGVPGFHQGEQVPAAECECTTIPIMHHWSVVVFSICLILQYFFTEVVFRCHGKVETKLIDKSIDLEVT